MRFTSYIVFTSDEHENASKKCINKNITVDLQLFRIILFRPDTVDIDVIKG